jgi:hypothetical protein
MYRLKETGFSLRRRENVMGKAKQVRKKKKAK